MSEVERHDFLLAECCIAPVLPVPILPFGQVWRRGVPSQSESAQRKLMWEVELSGVFEVRAATR